MQIPIFDNNSLRSICNLLGDTNEGLTGTEICQLLNQLKILDIKPDTNKRNRLFEALFEKQKQDMCGNNIIEFIKKSMDPIRYTDNLEHFNERKSKLNQILALRGYELLDNGYIQMVNKVDTISEAQKKADHLKKKLNDKDVHSDILDFCTAELLADNYFHAVFEATKSVADKIRNKSGIDLDGSELVDAVFSIKRPILIINNLKTKTEQSEQKGFANLLKGVFGTFRNVTAHEPKIKWKIEEQDALDLLSLLSYIHRRLDSCTTPSFKSNTST
jgi:uncharacterized protein (TIGR02391 family)